ncbi:hypothetical protein [Nocardia sp. AG03]|uniref:hypothetical protein n=1 Tax=Nocardia sp. AG03 TaxID=3025312 RepID=UPI002418B874|nr:hypothetical protein [Nocardia sp. AG03]
MFSKFEEFAGTARIPAIKFVAVRELTQLHWRKVTEPVEIPAAGGVYAWVDPATDLVHYHGSGSGAAGLRKRLGDQLRWQAAQRQRIADAERLDEIDSWFRVVIESPAIRLAAEGAFDLWIAVAREPEWSLGTEEDANLPTSPLGWESFIYECSHLVTGRRSLLGGGAWESKPGSLGYVMERVAWSRLRQVRGI